VYGESFWKDIQRCAFRGESGYFRVVGRVAAGKMKLWQVILFVFCWRTTVRTQFSISSGMPLILGASGEFTCQEHMALCLVCFLESMDWQRSMDFSVFNISYQIAVNTLKRSSINWVLYRLLPNSYPLKSFFTFVGIVTVCKIVSVPNRRSVQKGGLNSRTCIRRSELEKLSIVRSSCLFDFLLRC